MRYIFLALAFLSACSAQPPAREDWHYPQITATTPMAANTLWVQSDSWKRNARAAFARATRHAEAAARTHKKGRWVVMLDIDETVLTNIEYHALRDRKDQAFTPETWRDWVEARKATLVPGAKEYIDRVNALGGQVALVTNRRSYEEEATIDNLDAVGLSYGRDYALLYTYAFPDGDKVKDARYRLAEDVLDASIVAYVGDQWTDQPSTPHKARFFCIAQGNLYGNPCEHE